MHIFNLMKTKWGVSIKKRAFIFNAAVLSCTGLLSRAMGIIFRIYMSNSVGAEAIGLYQIIATVYFFCATLATSGISLSITRLVSEEIAKGNLSKVRYIIRYCVIISLVISSISGCALYVGSSYISVHILHDIRTQIPLKILAPSLPFMALSACFRGYFYAVRQIIKTASEQLLEQIIEVSVFAFLIRFMGSSSVELACCYIVAGTTAAEVISFFYSMTLYYLDIRNKYTNIDRYPNILKKILSISVPVTASSCLRSALNTIENILIPSGLIRYGSSSKDSLSSYGMLSGMVFPVLCFPSVVLFSLSTLLIPELSEANAIKDKKNINNISTKIFGMTFMFSILMSGVLMFLPQEISGLVYIDQRPSVYIRIFAPLVPLIYLDSMVDGMLKGLNEQLHYMSYNLIDASVRVIFIYFLLPIKGINGLIIVMFISTILNSSLSVLRVIKVTKLNVDVVNWIFKPVICVALSCLLCKYLTQFLYISGVLALAFRILMIICIYLIAICLSGAVNFNIHKGNIKHKHCKA